MAVYRRERVLSAVGVLGIVLGRVAAGLGRGRGARRAHLAARRLALGAGHHPAAA
jgi:hypothetical protein